MAFNAFESIANDFSSTRKKLKRYSSSPEGLRPAAPPAPPPAAPPTPVAPARTPVAAPVTPLASGVAEALAVLQQPRPMAAQPTKMPTDVAVALGALQQRGEQFGVDTTEFNYAAPNWGKVAAQMGEVNKVFDQMDSEIEAPSFEERQNGGLYGVIDRNLGSNYPHLFAESNPDASFWDRSIGRTTGAVGRGLRQTIGRPARGLWRFGSEAAQDWVGSNEEAIANLDRSEGEVVSSIFSDLGVVDPEQWNDLIKTEGQVKADLLLSRRWLAEMGSSSFEIGTQATSEFTDEENLARNQYRIKRLLEIDPATGKTRAEGQLKAGQNPAKIMGIGLAILEASEGPVTLASRLALSQIGRQIDIANGGDGSKGEMWGDIIGSFAGGFPKNPASGTRTFGVVKQVDKATDVARGIKSGATALTPGEGVASGLRAIDRPVQQGSGITGATGLDFFGSEVRDAGGLAKLAATPLSAGVIAGAGGLGRYAEAVGRAGVGNALDPVPPSVSRGMAEINKELQAKIDKIDRAFKDGDLTPLQYQEMLQAVGDPTVAPKSILPEGGILGDDFGKAPEGTVITIDGVETRLGPDGKPIVETTDQPLYPDPASPDPYRIQPEPLEGRTAQQRRSDRIREEDAAKAALEAGEFAEPDFAYEIGDTVSNASYLRFGEVVYIGDDVQPWKVDRVNGQLVDLDYIYKDIDTGGFVGLRAEKSHDVSKTPLTRSGFDYKNEVIPPRGTYKRESLDIAPSAPVAPVKAPRVTIRNVNKALADAGHNAKVHKGKDYIYFSGDDIDNWAKTSVSVPRLTDDLGLDTPATVDNWVKEFERMKANPDINPVPLRNQVNEYGALTPEAMQVRAAEFEEWKLKQRAESLSANDHAELVKNDPAVVAARRQFNIAVSKTRKYEDMPPADRGPTWADEYKVLQEDEINTNRILADTKRNAVVPTKEEIAQAAREQDAIDASTKQSGFDITATDDIPTSGQATLDGGVVAARTEQDIVDARTVQSGFDLTATGEDAPLRQAAAADSGVVDLDEKLALDPAVKTPRSGSPQDALSINQGSMEEFPRYWYHSPPSKVPVSASARKILKDNSRPEDGGLNAYILKEQEAKAILGDVNIKGIWLSPTKDYGESSVLVDISKLDNNSMYSEQSGIVHRGDIPKSAIVDQPTTPATGTAAAAADEPTPQQMMDRLMDSGDREQALEAAAAAPPAPADEVVINGKKYVEAPETPAEPVARAGGVIEPPSALFLPKSADEAAARLNADADDDWTYVVRHDPKNTGGSWIDILDEDGERVGPVTDEIAKGDNAFVYNDAGDRVRIDLIEGDEAFYTSANKQTRKPADRAAIESRLTPAAPEPPVAADPKYESQHGFNDDGTLTTFESQATEGIEQFDDQLAQSEMRLPKTQAELDAEQAAMDAYFDETEYLVDFKDGETVDNAPLFETRHADTPLGNAERKVDELEKELEGQEGYELGIKMEAIREEIDQSLLAPAMEVFDARGFPEEGLYADQYYKIFGDSGVRLIPTGSKGNVVQRDYITWAQKAHPKDFKADRMVNKVFGAERRALSQKRNYTINLEHTDEVPEQWGLDYIAEGYDGVVRLLSDIKSLRSQRDELLDYDANIKGIELEDAAELKEAKRQELLAANDEVILQQGIVEPPRGSLNAEGTTREFSEASRIPQVGTQNPPDYSIGNNREIAERTINNLRGPYTPLEVAALPDNLLARLVAENISTQNPNRGTMSTGGQGVNPNAVDPVVGRGDPVEQGLEYPVPGTNQATQSSQLEVERATRIQPSKGAPYKINSPEEADNALGAVFMPNTEVKVQVAGSNLRGIIASGGERVDGENAFVNAMPGKEIIPTKEMLKDVAEQNLNDIGSRTAFRLDPGRIANTVDQGQVIGATTNSIIETTQRTDDAGRIWLDTGFRDWDRLLKKYRIRGASVFKIHRNNDLQQLTNVMERLSGNDVMRLSSNPRLAKEGVEEFVPAEELLNKPSIKKAVQGLAYDDKIRFIQAAQDGRIFLDNIRNFQNKVRNKRGQTLIPWLPDYMPHIRRMTKWSKLGGLYEQSDIAGRDMPDFTLPGKQFNPRELARKWGIKDEARELNADKLIRSYLTTAMKDVFHTEIDRNIKANTKLWREATKDDYTLVNAADAFDNYSAEAYLGVPSDASKLIRKIWLVNRRLPVKYLVGSKLGADKALPSAIDATVMLKTGLTRSVFPFNWTWNTFIQTSSGLLTPVRYGVRNSIKALDAITSSSVKQDIEKFAYVARTKGRRGSSVVMQNTGDDVYAFSEDIPWQDRALEWASFLSIQIEKNLTRHAIRAAYLRGQKLGYEGAELWQYASQGGARTQSMYNKADTVGALRSRELSSMIPFQTFAFEMFNTLAETNVPIARNFTGKLGAYESFSANTARGKATTYGRLKNLAIWFAGAIAINLVADRASNRKPWAISSFIPAWAFLSGGVNGLGPGGALLPAKFLYDAKSAYTSYAHHGDWRGLSSVGLRYFGLPGGTQIDKSWAGAEAVQEGVVRNADRTTKFEVQSPQMKGITFDIPFIGETNITDAKINPEEFIKSYGQGIWSTNGGQEYLDQQLGRSTEGQSTFGKFKAGVAESIGLQKFPIDRGGKQGGLNRDYEKAKDAYYKIPTDPDVRKERGLPTRTEFRRRNPELDAQLFVAGQFSTLQSPKAKRIAKELIVEHDLLNQGGGFFTGRGVDQKQEDIFRNVFGDRWVDGVIGGKGSSSPMDEIRPNFKPLDFSRTKDPEPQSSAPQTANEQWRLASTYLTRDNLVALQKIWDGEPVSRPESASLKAVFEKVPLGQTNFRKWSKQTLRQVHENATVQMPREAVTV